MKFRDKPVGEKIAILGLIGTCVASFSKLAAPYVKAHAETIKTRWKEKHNMQKQQEQAKADEKSQPSMLPSRVYGKGTLTGCAVPTHGKWLLEGFFTAGEINAICSSDGQFKTGLFHQFLDDVATGAASKIIPTASPLPSGQRVIVYESELTEEDYAERGYDRNIEVIFGSQFKSIDEFLSDISMRVEKIQESTVIGIDDITYAIPSPDPESARICVNQIKNLIEQKKAEGITLTIIYVCHADKELKPYESINLSSVYGCGNLVRAGANVVAIGPTRFGDDVKLIKNLKPRHGARTSKVNVVRQISKGFFHLEHMKYMEEEDVLPLKIKSKESASGLTGSSQLSGTKMSPKDQLMQWWQSADTKPTSMQIAEKFNISKRTADNWKKDLGLSKTYKPRRGK